MSKILKKFAAIIGVIAIMGASFVGCQKTATNDENGVELQTVRLNEVVRSVFYAPMYVAITEGFFEEEGVKIDLSTGQGADKTMQQLLSGNVDIGFSGPEQAIYIYNQGREDYPVVFGQLTQRDGSFLVGREAEENFDWTSLKGKELIGGRPGGIPEMALEYVLKENGLDPSTDVNMITNIDFTATSGAFKSGAGDYVALFEPTATMLGNDGSGNIVASVGESAGNIAYTCFYTTKSYMDENKEVLQRFTNAIYKGQQWVKEHTSDEVAESIVSYFPGTDEKVIEQVIDNYKSIDAYSETPVVSEDGLNRLMDIIQGYDSSLIQTRPDFDTIVNNDFANEAIK
ncbi:ABC transporter substrate-binding protein [uncultured Clostridium sp.]|uniref:ABC transporter substrate-binding protein n=1 Tax=uncultured Clostridium sp. TaxID=59620 RepID=UPI0025DD83B3|nr:ABC transporter substrate-binding protein [uncultured Clostridium sp.]MDU4883332.1 ABC transporter substrate-binding protein [Clostridium celatum]MDU7076321.1 ABC transporter substrate-binding protein [Clostridium celatum]